MTASDTLAYIQVGTFLTVISIYNYCTTFILMTVCRACVPQHYVISTAVSICPIQALFLILDSRKEADTNILLRTRSDSRVECMELNRQDLMTLS